MQHRHAPLIVAAIGISLAIMYGIMMTAAAIFTPVNKCDGALIVGEGGYTHTYCAHFNGLTKKNADRAKD